MSEPPGGVSGRDSRKRLAHRFHQRLWRARRRFPEISLNFRERFLYRVEIRRIGRQEPQLASPLLDQLPLLLNVFFSRAWFEDVEARELTDQQAQHALDVATQAAVSSSPMVPYNPYLVQQTVEVARADYSTGVMITMLIITVVPLIVAALAYFLVPRRPQQAPQAAPTGSQRTEQPGPAP